MTRPVLYKLIIFLIVAFNAQIIFSHNLSSSSKKGTILEQNSKLYRPLQLEFENQYYNNKIDNIDLIPGESFGDISFDSTNSEEYQRERRLLPEDMSWMENFLWGVHGLFRSGELTAQKRKSDLVLRRDMLIWHQRLGIATWLLMGATVLAGQLTLNGNRKFRQWHSPLAEATIIGYSATGLLAILAPPPLIRRPGDHDTIFWHKILAWVHAAGMIALPILANNIVHRSRFRGVRGPENFNMARARAHQITGYITFATFTAAIVTIFF